MITFNKFKEIIVKYIRFSHMEEQLRKMNIDIVETPLFSTSGYFLDWLWEAYFEEDAQDTIAWWMFEYHELAEDFDDDGNFIGGEMEPGMWDKDDKVIPMITIEDLWNEVQDQRKKFVQSPKEAMKEIITDMVTAHLKSAVKPANVDTLKDATDEYWDKLVELFDNPDKLVCVDNTDEAIADIMATYLENKIAYISEDAESCHIEVFLDTNVGTVLVLSADDYELYVWQG